MATAFIDSKTVTRIRIPPAATICEHPVRLLGVIVDLDRKRRVAIERALGQSRMRPGRAHHEQRGRLADRPGEAENRPSQDPRQGRRAARGREPSASESPPVPARPGAVRRDGPQRLLGGDHDDRQDQQAERQHAREQAAPGPVP